MNLYDREQEIYGKKHFKHDAGFDGIVTLAGGKRVGVKSVTAAYTITDTDGVEYLLVTTGATNMTITLPTAKDNTGREITIRKVDTGAGKITVDGEGSETIDGNTTVGIWYVNNFLTLLCTGTGWLIVGSPDPIFIPEESRPTAWANALLNAATTRGVWTDADASSFAPAGAKHLLLYVLVSWVGDGALDYSFIMFRKNGSAVALNEITLNAHFQVFTNLGNTLGTEERDLVWCDCDTGRFVEYFLAAASGSQAAGTAYAVVHGYSMM